MRRSSSRIALLVGSLALVLTGCSVQDAESKLRFGFPTGVTKQAERMRVLWTWTGVTALAVGVVVWFLIFWAIIRYRKKDDELPKQTKYNLPLEIVYSIIPFIFIAGLFYRTVVVENYVNKTTPNPDAVVMADAFKWNWQFEYYQGLGKPLTYSDGSPVGTTGSDDEIPVLVVPVNQKVRVIEHSEDVIHAFWVPEFLFKRDVIPYGTDSTEFDNEFEFTAVQTGAYVGRCAELCGTYHSQMNFEVRVVTRADYDAYVAKLKSITPDDPNFTNRQAIALGAISDPKLNGPKATTTYPFETKRTLKGPSEKSGS